LAIDQKVAGQEVTMAPAESPRAQIVDLMEALKASLAAKSAGSASPRREAKRAEPEPVPERTAKVARGGKKS
jgi:DNA end-binding protein Ku